MSPLSLPVSLPPSLCPAGLEDMVLSALVQEQMEGLIPEAIALIPPTKMAVSLSLVHLRILKSWFG